MKNNIKTNMIKAPNWIPPLLLLLGYVYGVGNVLAMGIWGAVIGLIIVLLGAKLIYK